VAGIGPRTGCGHPTERIEDVASLQPPPAQRGRARRHADRARIERPRAPCSPPTGGSAGSACARPTAFPATAWATNGWSRSTATPAGSRRPTSPASV